VAVKTLRDDKIPINRAEFMREAEVMTNLDHHCIVKLISECLLRQQYTSRDRY